MSVVAVKVYEKSIIMSAVPDMEEAQEGEV